MFSDLMWALYWIDILSGLKSGIFWGMLLALIAGGLARWFAAAMREEEGGTREQCITSAKKWGFIVMSGMMIGILLLAFVPTKSTMYMMLGAKTTDTVVNSDLGKKLQKIVDYEVDNYLKKFEPAKKE